MADKKKKPTVLVLGGCSEGQARAILTFLVPIGEKGGERKASHVRLVDKHLVVPQANAYTVYMDPLSKKALQEPDVEYMQANLLIEDSRRKAFTPPPSHGPSYNYIFDFTGETPYESSPEVYAERTTKLLPLLGRLAVQKGVEAYVREAPYTYKPGGKGEKGRLGDGEGEPVGERGRWTHEGIRALAAVPNLNLVLVRPGLLYGPYTTTGYTPRLLTGEIYKYLSEPLHFLWSSDLKLNTVHSHDFASAFLALAEWASRTPSSERAALATPIRSCLTESERKLLPTTNEKGGWPGEKQEVKGVWFNVVDEGDTTQGIMAELTGKVVGVEVGFHSAVINSFAKLNMDDVVEDVNEKHLSTWVEMLANSSPPISNAPISPYVPLDLLSKNAVSLDGKRMREVVKWRPRVEGMGVKEVTEMLDLFRKEGFWPNAPPLHKK